MTTAEKHRLIELAIEMGADGYEVDELEIRMQFHHEHRRGVERFFDALRALRALKETYVRGHYDSGRSFCTVSVQGVDHD